MNDSRATAVAAAQAAAAKQASDIVILDVRELIVITDYFVIASGSSDRQVRTMVEEIEKGVRERLGVKPVRREGEDGWQWVLLDYVDVVVHVFSEEQREYYDLERLWRDAPRVEWEESDAVSSG
ncbi:MAG TPA: ribosome silencing factor [Actinomycetota bacterium]|jgi:ribosome-associated protein|nr:ribosome silencing factor [Actinomycetota bacterium]